MDKKTKKLSFLIPLILGLGCFIAAIIIVVNFSQTMGTNLFFLIPLLFVSGGISIFIITPVVFLVSHNQKPEENLTDEKFYEGLKELRSSIKKLTKKECPYCGAELSQEDKQCKNCGAKNID